MQQTQIFVYTLLVEHDTMPFVGVYTSEDEARKVGREIQSDVFTINGINVSAYIQRHRVPLNDEVEIVS